ncbi:GNAT family protein [Isoptericola sp. b441]|uniref:GNAT family protein n=1 Tax=Actinotalea lenta TaxID=3064654 RepID=A0ABT9DAF4_9CELL|nr:MULTISPECIES: GNAT family protein [unclassified Isoptericola]MDO8107545.1 GNAT family protein [Isoptericola sp. b441]MDO8120795.1 GNAT family protein [Isoptericola sp. b490]
MEPVELTDGVVRLSVPTAAHVDAITVACQDPQIQAWTTVPSPYEREHAEGFVQGWGVRGWAEDRHATWGIWETGVLRGMVGLAMHPPGSAEIGYWMAPEGRGRGVLHRAVLLVLGWAFDDPCGPRLEQVEWHAFAGNWPSWRVAWRVGFRFEAAVRLGADQRGERRGDWGATLLRDDPREPVAPWPATAIAAPTPPDGPVHAVPDRA